MEDSKTANAAAAIAAAAACAADAAVAAAIPEGQGCGRSGRYCAEFAAQEQQ